MEAGEKVLPVTLLDNNNDPITGFQGWLVKVGSGLTLIPTKYIAAETYKITPDQRMEETAERDVTGKLHRETVENMPVKIEFETPPMLSNTDVAALNTILSNAYSSAPERKLLVAYYDPEEDAYKQEYCYVPNVDYPIRNIDVTGKKITYDAIRYAFIGY